MQLWLLVLLIAGALAALGGGYPGAAGPIAFGTLVVAVAGARHTFRFARETRTLDLALAAVVVAIAVQLAPLPPNIADAVTPHAARLRNILRLDAAMFEGRPVATSIHPAATFESLLIVIATVLTFLGARAVFARGGIRWFCRAIATIGFLLTLEAIIQRAVSPDRIYGIVPPLTSGAKPFGPFVNRNHFAGWLLMALPLVAGYLAARVRTRAGDRVDIVRVVARAGGPLVVTLVAILGGLAATLSRSAMVGLGIAALAAWRMARRRVEINAHIAAPLFAAAGAMLVLLMAAVDLDQWAIRLNATMSETPSSRLTIWRESLPLLRDFWLTGIGAGTYSMAMLVYQQTVVPMPHLRDVAHFNQAHSHYLQAAIEGGALVMTPAVVAAVCFVRAARAALRADIGEAVWIRIGAASSLAGISAQSVWETSLVMPANALFCAALAGLAVHRRVSESASAYADEPSHNGESDTRVDRRHLVEHR